MSPDKKKRLNILRKKLDSLDNKLIKLVKQRTNIVSDVLKLKTHKYEIVDKKRISIILKNIKNKSIKASEIKNRLTKISEIIKSLKK